MGKIVNIEDVLLMCEENGYDRQEVEDALSYVVDDISNYNLCLNYSCLNNNDMADILHVENEISRYQLVNQDNIVINNKNVTYKRIECDFEFIMYEKGRTYIPAGCFTLYFYDAFDGDGKLLATMTIPGNSLYENGTFRTNISVPSSVLENDMSLGIRYNDNGIEPFEYGHMSISTRKDDYELDISDNGGIQYVNIYDGPGDLFDIGIEAGIERGSFDDYPARTVRLYLTNNTDDAQDFSILFSVSDEEQHYVMFDGGEISPNDSQTYSFTIEGEGNSFAFINSNSGGYIKIIANGVDLVTGYARFDNAQSLAINSITNGEELKIKTNNKWQESYGSLFIDAVLQNT